MQGISGEQSPCVREQYVLEARRCTRRREDGNKMMTYGEKAVNTRRLSEHGVTEGAFRKREMNTYTSVHCYGLQRGSRNLLACLAFQSFYAYTFPFQISIQILGCLFGSRFGENLALFWLLKLVSIKFEDDNIIVAILCTPNNKIFASGNSECVPFIENPDSKLCPLTPPSPHTTPKPNSLSCLPARPSYMQKPISSHIIRFPYPHILRLQTLFLPRSSLSLSSPLSLRKATNPNNNNTPSQPTVPPNTPPSHRFQTPFAAAAAHNIPPAHTQAHSPVHNPVHIQVHIQVHTEAHTEVLPTPAPAAAVPQLVVEARSTCPAAGRTQTVVPHHRRNSPEAGARRIAVGRFGVGGCTGRERGCRGVGAWALRTRGTGPERVMGRGRGRA